MRLKAGLYIICFIFLLALLFCQSASWAVPTSYQAMQELQEAERQAQEAPVITVPQVKYTAEDLRDPFVPEPIQEEEEEKEEKKPRSFEKTPLPTLIIRGIVWGGQLPQAIVNDRVVRIGDIIEGVRIVNISREGITIFHNGREQLITSPAANALNKEEPNLEGGER